MMHTYMHGPRKVWKSGGMRSNVEGTISPFPLFEWGKRICQIWGSGSDCSDGPDMVEGAHDFVYIRLDF